MYEPYDGSLFDDGPHRSGMPFALICCAWCRHADTHPCEPSVHLTDDYDPDNPIGTRGSWVDLSFVCEACDNHTAFVAAFHKGSTFAGIFLKRIDVLLGALSDCDDVEESGFWTTDECGVPHRIHLRTASGGS